MKSVKLSELKQKMTTQDVKDSPCFELTSDGEPIAIVIVSAEGAMAERIKGLASLVDAGRGK